jgi:hypothetical protein
MVEGKPLKEVLASLRRKPLHDLVHHEAWVRTRAAPGDDEA